MATLTLDCSSIEITDGVIRLDGKRLPGRLPPTVLTVRIENGVIEEVKASGNVHCGVVQGNVSAGGSVDCEDVHGNVEAQGAVNASRVIGTVGKRAIRPRQIPARSKTG